ncbi:MAG: prepilin-type N-terminal cleavage/methylation domain-containing protein [Planctomycetota bacterium]
MRRAFSLVELLVVVSVVALLIGLLLPTLSSARATARQTACVANMRSIGQAHAVYLVESDGRMLGTSHGTSWMDVLSGYTASLLMRSPVDDSPYFDVPHAVSGVERRTSYALNFLVSPDNGDVAAVGRVEDVLRLSATAHAVIKVYESTGGAATADHVHPSLWAPSLLPPAEVAATEVQTHAYAGRFATSDAVSGYLFLDGHASAHAFSDVFVSRNKNRFFP